MKRLFLAIPIKTNDNGFIPLLDGLRRQLAHEKRINWVKPEHIHLTLKFIGNTPNEDIPKIIEAVGTIPDWTDTVDRSDEGGHRPPSHLVGHL